MELQGRSIIGSVRSVGGAGELFYATNPRTGERILPSFSSAPPRDLERAVQIAHEAFAVYSCLPGRRKVALLRGIAANIERVAAEIVYRANQETALPQARLQGEIVRTCGQLRMFAELVEEGSWVMARIDRPDPARRPLPKPDVRSMLRPLGPVVVFGASNFPLAFSVAGGDTASALAAGNPVIVKAHPAHPGTSELVGLAVQDSVRECGLPEGTFSLLFDRGNQVGVSLVTHPLIKAAGFTGSRAGGMALAAIAASRLEPIPFYAEMSSTNPVFILPGALRERSDDIAAGLYASFTLGAGQFCTKPGIIFVPKIDDVPTFLAKLHPLVKQSAPFHLLTESIRSSYRAKLHARKARAGVVLVAATPPEPGADNLGVGAALFETDARTFRSDADMAFELFGPATLLINLANRDELIAAANALEGQLTAAIHANEQDLLDFADLIAILERKVGRLVLNGFPTGVEVCHSMVHGGPYPSTSDGRSTSVGTQAIFRFCRPVCYQGFPQSALPDELKDANPTGIWQMVDGQLTRNSRAASLATPRD